MPKKKSFGPIPDVPALMDMVRNHGLPCRLQAVDRSESIYGATIHMKGDLRLQAASFRASAARMLTQPGKCVVTPTVP